MITFTCKKKGVVDSHDCFNCFNNPDNEWLAATRVLCKRENVVEEISSTNIVVKQQIPVEPEAREMEETVEKEAVAVEKAD